MAEIKNCPLCGGPGALKDGRGSRIRQGWVGCPACQLYISWKISPDGAVRKWNRRCEGGAGGASSAPTGGTEVGT